MDPILIVSVETAELISCLSDWAVTSQLRSDEGALEALKLHATKERVPA